MTIEPIEPPPGLLMSMAIRFDHGLGIPGYYGDQHAAHLRAILGTMRQLWEEVAGIGFYAAERAGFYETVEKQILGE